MDCLSEKCKSILSTLLQLKHMLLFVDHNLSSENRRQLDILAPDFPAVLASYLAKYNELLDDGQQDVISKYIKQKESIFGSNKTFCVLSSLPQSVIEANQEISGKDILSKVVLKRQKKVTLKPKSNIRSTKKNCNVKRSTATNVQYSNENIVYDDIDSKPESMSTGDVAICIDSDDTLCCSTDEEEIDRETKVNSHANGEESSADLFGIPINYSCLLENCKFRSNSLAELKAHELRNHANKQYKCPQRGCAQVFTTGVDLSSHLVSVHQIFRCIIDKCNCKFSNEFKLNNHIKREHAKAYLTCSLCDKTFKNRATMKKHSRMMHVEGTYKCKYEDCDFVAKFRKELLYHKTTKHLLKTCPDCGRSVPSNCFQRHLKVHKQIKNYVCSWPDCGKAFSESKTLKDHVRIHLNFKRYRCKWPECCYACEQQSNLITHIRVRHFKVPQTKKKQLEMNISLESIPDPFEYMEICNEDICIKNIKN